MSMRKISSDYKDYKVLLEAYLTSKALSPLHKDTKRLRKICERHIKVLLGDIRSKLVELRASKKTTPPIDLFGENLHTEIDKQIGALEKILDELHSN